MKLDVQPKCLAVGPGGYTVVVCIGQVRPASAPSVRAGPRAHAAAPPREEAGTLLAKGLRSWSHPGRAGAVAASPSGLPRSPLTAHGRVTRKDMSRSRLLCKFFRKRGAWSSERPGDFSTAAWWWRGPTQSGVCRPSSTAWFSFKTASPPCPSLWEFLERRALDGGPLPDPLCTGLCSVC